MLPKSPVSGEDFTHHAVDPVGHAQRPHPGAEIQIGTGEQKAGVLPQMGAAQGMDFGEVCEKIIAVSMEKYK